MELAGEGKRVKVELVRDVVVVAIARQAGIAVEYLGAENGTNLTELLGSGVVALAGIEKKFIAALEVGVVVQHDQLAIIDIVGGVEAAVVVL